MKRISLSEHAHYATPEIHFDQHKRKRTSVCLSCLWNCHNNCNVDCLRGIYEFDAVKVVHDFGTTMNPVVDRGQIEGGHCAGHWLDDDGRNYL